MDRLVMNRLTDVTFVIPVRVDSPLRSRNLDLLIDFITKNFDSKILVMETDSCQRYFVKNNNHRLQYFFQEDPRPVFHHTWSMNLLYRKVDTPIIAGWDTDALVSAEQIIDTVEQIRNETAVIGYPYERRMKTTAETARIYQDTLNLEFLNEITGEHRTDYEHFSTGGGFIVNAEKYLQAGGENELFIGWGCEDLERARRMEILYSQPIYRAKGKMYHLWHPRYLNSRFADQQSEINAKKEFLKVCGMTADELRNYIMSWPWLEDLQNQADKICK